MAGHAVAPSAPMPERGLALERPSLGKRLLGIGSVFGKSLRDSRRTAIVLGVLYALIVVVTASQIITEFDTVAKRQQMVLQFASLPAVFQGFLGEPLGIDRLGGFISWRVLNFLPVMYGIWAIVALSGTLAGELARGSLDVLAATPLVRRRLAVEKVLAYVVALAITVLLIGLGTIATSAALAKLPGDEISAAAVAAHMTWLLGMCLFPGAVAFATAPFLGRGGAIGAGAVVLFASFIVSGYSSMVPAFENVQGLSYFHTTAGFRPLADAWDWGSLGILAAVTLVLLVLGIEAFARRDMLVPTGGRFSLPPLRLWIADPFTRGLGERFPAALAWGGLLGLFGLTIASSTDQFVAALSKIPQVIAMIQRLYPDADILSAGGFLQLSFFSQGIIIVGIAAAAYVGGWASDEGERRLEVLLGAPLSRVTWSIRSGLAVYAAVAVTVVVLAVGVAVGAAAGGQSAGDSPLGVFVLGLYGIALAGIGLAVGGLVRPSIAAPVTLVVAVGSFLLDIIGPILKLPDWVLDLALNRHLGRPMLGDFDTGGIVLMVGIAVGGLALSAYGMQRRDVGR